MRHGRRVAHHPKRAASGRLCVSHVVLSMLSFAGNSQTKIANLAVLLVLVKHNVGRLEITMDNSKLVELETEI